MTEGTEPPLRASRLHDLVYATLDENFRLYESCPDSCPHHEPDDDEMQELASAVVDRLRTELFGSR